MLVAPVSVFLGPEGGVETRGWKVWKARVSTLQMGPANVNVSEKNMLIAIYIA